MIPDHCGFPMDSDFQSDPPLTMRTAIVTANWRGCALYPPQGFDVEQQLPVLSTYLRHACVRDTYWYLSACPELMEETVRRLDRRWAAKP
jgi:hypothetical protein